MENGFNDFMLGFLYWTISQCSVFCWKLILGISFCFVFLWRGWCRGFFSFFFSVILMWNSQRAADQKYWLADVCRTALPPPTRSSSVFSGEDGASLLQAMQQEGATLVATSWLAFAMSPPGSCHLLSAKECMRGRRKHSGGCIWISVRSPLSMSSLMHLVATTTTKDNVLPYILLPSPPRFPLGRCYLPEVWSPPSNVLLIRLVAPSSAFLFLFLAAIFSNELGSLFCKKFIRLSCIPFKPYFPIK